MYMKGEMTMSGKGEAAGTTGGRSGRISAAEFTRATGVQPGRSSRAVANLTAGGARNAAEQRRISNTRFEANTGVSRTRSSQAVANLNAGGRRAAEENRRINRRRGG